MTPSITNSLPVQPDCCGSDKCQSCDFRNPFCRSARYCSCLRKTIPYQTKLCHSQRLEGITSAGIRVLLTGYFLLLVAVAGEAQAAGLQETETGGQEVRSTETRSTDIRPQVLFNRGNYLIEEQDFIHALETFRDLEKQGYIAGPLFYNIGISYAYLDSLGMASYYFHKSARFRDIGNRADAGISFIEDQMRNRGTYVPGLPWYAFVDWMLFDVNHSGWIVRGLILLNIGVLVLLFGWLYLPVRFLVIGGTAAAIVGLLIIATGSVIFIWSSNHDRAIVIESRVPLYPSPIDVTDISTGESSIVKDKSDLAYEGNSVTLNRRISREHSGWVYTRLRNGVTGWVPESSVLIL